MSFHPISAARLPGELAEAIVSRTGRQRVVLDGAPVAAPGALADAIGERLRAEGRPVLRVSTWDFLRPASLRLEAGRHNPDAFRAEWLDVAALAREVLEPLATGGSGLALPALWDAAADRAYRRARVALAEDGVLLADGALTLGRGLPWDLTVHLALREGTLARLLPADERWQLPGYARYLAEVDPVGTADIVIRADHPDRPAVLRRG